MSGTTVNVDCAFLDEGTARRYADFISLAYRSLHKMLYRNRLPRVDIVVCDSRCPGMEGNLGAFNPDPNPTITVNLENILQSQGNPCEATAETLAHEMVHLYCYANDIEDCYLGGNLPAYHNERFRDAARARCIYCSKGEHGWNNTQLTKQAWRTIHANYPELSAIIERGEI